MLTDDQLRFACRVLETPVGVPCFDDDADGVNEARDEVARRYRAAKQTNPTLSYGECSLRARVAWLREWLAKREG